MGALCIRRVNDHHYSTCNDDINKQIMAMSIEFNRTTAELNKTIQHFQDRVTLDEALKNALTDFMSK